MSEAKRTADRPTGDRPTGDRPKYEVEVSGAAPSVDAMASDDQAVTALTIEQLESELNDRQAKFAHAYARLLNATAAAYEAGYQGDDAALAVQGHRLLRNAKVSRLISAICSEGEMTAAELKARLAARSRADLTDFYDVDGRGDLQINLAKAQARGSMPALRSISQRKTTRTQLDGSEVTTTSTNITLHNPLPAEKLLSEILGLTDQDEGNGGVSASQRALQAVAEALAKRAAQLKK